MIIALLVVLILLCVSLWLNIRKVNKNIIIINDSFSKLYTKIEKLIRGL